MGALKASRARRAGAPERGPAGAGVRAPRRQPRLGDGAADRAGKGARAFPILRRDAARAVRPPRGRRRTDPATARVTRHEEQTDAPLAGGADRLTGVAGARGRELIESAIAAARDLIGMELAFLSEITPDE